MAVDNVRLFVAYHAPGPHPEDVPGYRAVCNVRADGSRPEGFTSYDDDHGLPERNREYCELSPFHKLLLEGDEEWIGLTHYRRLFTVDPRIGTTSRYPGYRRAHEFDWAVPEAYGSAASQLEQAVAGADWVSPARLDVRRFGVSSALEQYVANHGRESLDLCDGVLRRRYPKVIGLIDYLARTTEIRPYNMMIARASLLREYGRFLWPVLDDCYRFGRRPLDAFQARWPGFLAERLHGYWLDVIAPPLVERRLPLLLLHGATVRNSSRPQQGVMSPGPEGRPLIAAVLAQLSPQHAARFARLEKRMSLLRA